MLNKLRIFALPAVVAAIAINALPVFSIQSPQPAVKKTRHYVFFNRDRERIAEANFLETSALEGAQLKYSWRELEPEPDAYDFAAVRQDLQFLTAKGKKLFIHLQDVSFSESHINVPRYLLRDGRYHGGAARQYHVGTDSKPLPGGWVARRWDPAIQERFHKLLAAMGKEFDGRIEGINFAETSIGVHVAESEASKDYGHEAYRDAIVTNMKALKRAFPRSATMQYANFMPGEELPEQDHSYLRTVYQQAKELKVGVGGPDLLPNRRYQLRHSYPLIRDCAGLIPTGIAVQDGNYEYVNPKTGRRVTITELLEFATDYLKVDYIFWGAQEPFYSEQLIPFLKR
jgi:hypothetical protein